MKLRKALGLIPLLLLLFALLAWELAGHGATGPMARWGYPSRIVGILLGWGADGTLWRHAWATVSVALAGLVLGAIAGGGLAYVCHASTTLKATFVPLLAVLNALPRVLLVPIFIALMGIGLLPKLLMVFAMTFFLFFFNTLAGLDGVDPRIAVNARLLGASPLQIVRHVYFPLVCSWLLASLRPAIGFAFIGAIISEYFGSVSGLGYLVDLAYGGLRYDAAMAGLLGILCLAGAMDYLVRQLEFFWFDGTGKRKDASS